MIDPHVHCRDWGESHKETIKHALHVAERAGISGIFDMPNTYPAITSRELAMKRINEADELKSNVFYGLYIGLTPYPVQISEAVSAWKELFPRVVGLKMYAGRSVGNLGITNEDAQKSVYQTLTDERYDGVLAVHCGKESLLKPNLWDPRMPISHSYSWPSESETKSIEDQIRFAAYSNFKGRLHIVHVSVPSSVELIDWVRGRDSIKISCGVTPHHCCLDYNSIPPPPEGLCYKINPSLRDKVSAKKMLQFLLEGKIDWVETDHSPHTLKEKLEKPYMSGFPGLPFYPHFINLLKEKGMSDRKIKKITHDNICKIFGFNVPELKIEPDYNLHSGYEVDVYKEKRK